MERKFLFFVMVMAVSTVFSQNQSIRKMCVYYDGNVVYKESISQIDSIIFVSEDIIVDIDTVHSTKENPLIVSDAIANQNGTLQWVKGYIVGFVSGMNISGATFGTSGASETNIMIAASASETNVNNCIPVQLPSGDIRNKLNLSANAGNLGKEVILYGELTTYFGTAGIKNVSYAQINGIGIGSEPVNATGATLNETLLTKASFNKFTAVSVTGNEVWTFDSKYGAKMSGYTNNASHTNEDWFISPAINLSGKSSASLIFDHARGPKGSINVALTNYTVWVSNNYTSGAPSTATWTELTDITHGTTAWGYVSSGEIAIPAENLKANCRIAFKYTCDDSESATWEIKNIIVE